MARRLCEALGERGVGLSLLAKSGQWLSALFWAILSRSFKSALAAKSAIGEYTSVLLPYKVYGS